MRKCIRCGCEMKENCAVKIEGAGYGIVLSSDETSYLVVEQESLKQPFALNVEKVSIYLEDLDRLN